MRGAANHIRRDFAERDAIGRIELAQSEAVAHNSVKRIIKPRHRQKALLHRRRDVGHELLVGEVAAGVDRARDGLLVGHLSLLVPLDHGIDAAQVRDDKAIETPLLLEDLGEHERVHVVRDAVDRVVRRHHRLRVPLDDAVAEVRKPVFVQHAFIDRGAQALAILLDVVDGVMLESGNELEIFRIIPLQTSDIGHAEAAGEERIFAVTLFDAPPIGIAADVDHRGAIDQSLVLRLDVRLLVPEVVDGAGFVGDCDRFFVEQVDIPRGGHGD